MEQKKFDCWCLLELFGHNKIAGRVQDSVAFGGVFVQIDVPETSTQPAFSRLLHPNAIYAINPVTEEVARKFAENLNTAPVKSWDIREFMDKLEQKKIEASASVDDKLYDVTDDDYDGR